MKTLFLLLALSWSTSNLFAQVELYSDKDFEGAQKTIFSNWSVSGIEDSWNDVISSIRVPEGWKVIAYRDKDFRGGSFIITKNWSVVSQFDPWNDQISSIQVERVNVYPPNPTFSEGMASGRPFSIPNMAPQSNNNNVNSEIRINVDWIFTLDDKPDIRKLGTPVILETPAGRFDSYRGITGGKSCGCIAVLYSMVGKREAALSWLKAAQSHNNNVLNLFNTYPDQTVNYVKTHWKDCKGFAISAPHGPLVVALFNQLIR